MSDSDSSLMFNESELKRLDIDFYNLGITGTSKCIEKVKKFTRFGDGRYGRVLPINKNSNNSNQINNSVDKSVDTTDTIEYSPYRELLIDSVSGKYIIRAALDVMKGNFEFQEGGFLGFLWNKVDEDEVSKNQKISMWKRIKLEFGFVGIQGTLLTTDEELLIEKCCPCAIGVLGYEVFEEYKQERLEKSKEIPCEKHEDVPCKKKDKPNGRKKILPN